MTVPHQKLTAGGETALLIQRMIPASRSLKIIRTVSDFILADTELAIRPAFNQSEYVEFRVMMHLMIQDHRVNARM